MVSSWILIIALYRSGIVVPSQVFIDKASCQKVEAEVVSIYAEITREKIYTKCVETKVEE